MSRIPPEPPVSPTGDALDRMAEALVPLNTVRRAAVLAELVARFILAEPRFARERLLGDHIRTVDAFLKEADR